MDSLSILCADERVLTYESLSLEIGDKMMEFEEASTEEEFEASIKAAKEYIQKVNDILPVLDELAAEYDGQIVIYKVDIDKERELAKAFNISSIPAVLYIPLDGEPVITIGSRGKEKFKKEIETILLTPEE